MIAAGAGYLASRVTGRATDDVYITYRFAHNLSDGEGLVFNVGEHVFGLSDPGVALLIAASRAITGVSVPVVGTILTALSLLAIAWLLWLDGSDSQRGADGLLAGWLVVTAPSIWLGQGSGPVVALSLAIVAARVCDRRPGVAGLVSGCAVWCRPDAVLAAAVIAGLQRRSPRKVLIYVVGLAAVVGLGLILAYQSFGRMLPSTLAAKHQFAALDPLTFGRLEFWRRAFAVFDGSVGGLGVVFAVLGLGGFVVVLTSGGIAARAVVIYGLVSALFYTCAGVPFFVWYTAPLTIAVLVGTAYAVSWVIRRAWSVREQHGRPAYAAAGLGLLLAVATVAWAANRGWAWLDSTAAVDWRWWAYRTAGAWIEKNSQPTESVALDEVGLLGYHSDRPILDLVGLVSPSSLPYAAVGDQVGAFLVWPTDFVVFHTFDRRGGTRPIVSRPWFRQSYAEVARFVHPADRAGAYVAIFHRVDASRIPPSRPPLARPD